MATKRKKVDVVIVGLGAAGGTAALPLARSGMDVLALEAGGRLTPRDFVPDEVRNDIRNFMGRPKANGEVPTLRATASETAGPPPFAIVMMNAVGGTSIHWTGQAWRFVPYNFRERSETIRRYGRGAIPDGVGLADWPITYNDLAPFYETVERTHGISGQAGNLRGGRDRRGNRFEGKRRSGYPMPPLRRSGWTDLMSDAASRLGWSPFPGPAGILSEDYRGRQACDYHGFCTYNGCHVSAKASTNVTTIPLAEQRKNFKVLTRARVTRILTDGDGKATGVEFVKGDETFIQPADAVILSTYVYENNRLLMLSRSKAHPRGIGNRRSQLGKHYMAHSYLTVNALFPGRRLNMFSGSGAQFTALDNWDADNFNHRGLGFINGATLSSGMENKPIGQARTTAPDVPQWGSGYKAWLKENANSVGSAFAQVPCMPYEANKLDLDPTAKDQHGVPRIRITFKLGENEERMGAFLRGKLEAWLQEAGAGLTWGGEEVTPIAVNSHAYGGTRMGTDPASSVVDEWGRVHGVPNLFVMGGSTFPSTTSKNPTQTIMALAWRTADHVVRDWERISK